MTSLNFFKAQATIQPVLLCAFVMLIFSSVAHAHPEDDLCGPGGVLDPQLCQQLSAVNSAEAGPYGLELWQDLEGQPRTWGETFVQFTKIGIAHILPGGTDHILFVLALFLGSSRWRSLLIQISAFTVAHTVTLGLAAAGAVNAPADVVEPLIALSIAVVAIENIAILEMAWWRPLVVFGFGLFHGLGFAGFVRDVGLPPEQFWSSLIGFNLGVEIGQLSVVALAAALGAAASRALNQGRLTYRQLIVIPGSLVIAAIGLWWALTRAFGP